MRKHFGPLFSFHLFYVLLLCQDTLIPTPELPYWILKLLVHLDISSSGYGQVDVDEKSEVGLAQLQRQIPLNEPTALMHLVEDVAGKDEDEDTRECKNLFKP